MILHLSDLSPEPLHQQISRQIREQILVGDLLEGDSMPSIRKLAHQQHVSVITVQRAYDDLEREGLLYARRGKGFFVAEQSDNSKRQLAVARMIEALKPAIEEAIASGLDINEILETVNNLLKSEK
jgi:DNA-binding transcriptional regulator YhcF (GntR family)